MPCQARLARPVRPGPRRRWEQPHEWESCHGIWPRRTVAVPNRLPCSVVWPRKPSPRSWRRDPDGEPRLSRRPPLTPRGRTRRRASCDAGPGRGCSGACSGLRCWCAIAAAARAGSWARSRSPTRCAVCWSRSASPRSRRRGTRAPRPDAPLSRPPSRVAGLVGSPRRPQRFRPPAAPCGGPAVTHKSGLPSETCQIRSQGYPGPRGDGVAR